MIFPTPPEFNTIVAAELTTPENEPVDVTFAEAATGTATADSSGSVSSSPVSFEYHMEIGVDDSELISDDPYVLAAVADVLSTPASKMFTEKAVDAINDMQDICADDFAVFCEDNPTPLGFSFADVRSLFDELMSSNEDVSVASTNPVATWYRRHLTEAAHHQHAGSAGMRFLQAMKDAVAPKHVLRQLKGLFDHRDHGRQDFHRRMEAGRPAQHERSGRRDHHNEPHDGPHRVGDNPSTWTPTRYRDRPVPDHAPATPVAPVAPAEPPATPVAPVAPAEPPAAGSSRHLLGESMQMPHFHMDEMPPAHFATSEPMPHMGAVHPGLFLGSLRAPMYVHNAARGDSGSDSDDDDEDEDDRPRLGRPFQFKGPYGRFPPAPPVGRMGGPPRDGPYGPGDFYGGALGFGAEGDSCIMLNYAKLSTDCKASLRAIGEVRAEYVGQSGNAHGRHGHHHHPLLFLALLGAFGYFFYKRHMKMKSIRRILNVVEANPSLKAQVEAAAGVEIPKHGKRCESVCNAFKCMFKSFGKAAIFLGAFFFIAVTTLTLSGIVVRGINHHQNRKCIEWNESLPAESMDPDVYNQAYQQCEGPGFGLILFVVFTIAAVETTVLVYFGKRIQSACGYTDAPSDADAPSVVNPGAYWYPGQIYAALPTDSSHGGAEMTTLAPNTGTSTVTVVSSTQPVQVREVRPYSQVTML